MPRITPEQWEKLRAEYEVGVKPISKLAADYGVTRTAIHKRIDKEGWLRDPRGDIEVATVAKVTGVGSHCNPEQRELAIQTEAERRAAVLLRHRDEWKDVDRAQEQAFEDFHNPPMIVEEIIDAEGNIRRKEIADYRRIGEALKLTQMRAIKQKSERVAHEVDHTANMEHILQNEQRGKLIQDTMSALREAVRRAREMDGKIIDITPEGGA